MSKKIIFRLDDYSHECNHRNWNYVIELFNSYKIKVCIGVIPDSRDSSLIYEKALSDELFWKNVRKHSNTGHIIALHGLHHTYHKIKKWTSLQLFPINDDSEFVSLSVLNQTSILKKAYKIFKSNDVTPDVFMAPSHSLDSNTLIALKDATPIRVISDGYYSSFRKYDEFVFVPCQVGSLKVLPFNLTCICLHPNTMSKDDFNNLNEFLSSNNISDFDVNFSTKIGDITFIDNIFSLFLLLIKSFLVWFNKKC